MKPFTLVLLTMVSFGIVAIASDAPAAACTPHPDNPDGCNNWPPRRINLEDLKIKKPIPWPGPVCLSCPSNILSQDQLILKESIVTPSSLDSESIQSFDRSMINRERLHY